MVQLGVIGECMLELSPQGDENFKLSYGGDVFNTAVYATRAGTTTSFFTAIGDDALSDYLMDAWQAEGVATDTVRVISGQTPSLYMIQTDESGERNFHYWRDTSPFIEWLAPGSYLEELPRLMRDCQVLYFSGISLALLPDHDKMRLLDILRDYRLKGGQVAFDPNYRARLWTNSGIAVHWIDQAYRNCDIAFPSYDDEIELHGEVTVEGISSRLKQLGVTEIVVKKGEDGAYLWSDSGPQRVPAAEVKNVVDTTAAGDAFNGGFLARRIHGEPSLVCVAAGNEVAAQVIQHPGAITFPD